MAMSQEAVSRKRMAMQPRQWRAACGRMGGVFICIDGCCLV